MSDENHELAMEQIECEQAEKKLALTKLASEEEHDLDGTPLPVGHQEYTAEQERFHALWKKWANGTITPEETAEMLKMQEDYWK